MKTLEDFKTENLYIQAIRKSRLRGVAQIIITRHAALNVHIGLDDAVDDAGVRQRTIARNPHDMVDMKLPGGLKIAVQDVVLTTPDALDTKAHREVTHRIVLWATCRRDNDVIQAPAKCEPFNQEFQERPAQNCFQHFPRQPG